MFAANRFGDIYAWGPSIGKVIMGSAANVDGAIRVSGDGGRISVRFDAGKTVALKHEGEKLFVLPHVQTAEADSLVWVIPEDFRSATPSVMVRAADSTPIEVAPCEAGVEITVRADECSLIPYDNRPRCDVLGNGFAFEMPGGDAWAEALAAFYWDTIIPCVIERTQARDYPDPDGYVLSTLGSMYGGTYPDVDHEFQIKGRLAVGSELDWAVARRMIDLQLRVMREDPQWLWRDPCAVQPDGTREYLVTRKSMDGSVEAEMFRLTGNVEVLEAAWLYAAASKDVDWLAERIDDLEGAASLIEKYTDDQFNVWADVYYEDQVMKNGRSAKATAFAANGLRCLAELETALNRCEQAEHYRKLSEGIAAGLSKPVPVGFWDEAEGRFVDWIDVNGRVHDHTHLLANTLPPLFGYASAGQAEHVAALMHKYDQEFQRFPSFMSADIAAYGLDEVGEAGPYDQCAAGRYWCWDAAYRHSTGDAATLKHQLDAVAAQGRKDGYAMGERYDMNHVYYIDDKDWHGAAHYYEYPCVFAWVLVHEYFGVRFAMDADLEIAPCLAEYGKVRLEMPHLAVAYEYAADRFVLTNLADRSRSFRVDLSRICGPGGEVARLEAGQTCEFSLAG